MPGKFYHLPYQSRQKGPSCWYVSMKAILRFHGYIPRNSLEEERTIAHHEWKALGKFKSKIPKGSDPGYRLDSIRPNLNCNSRYEQDAYYRSQKLKSLNRRDIFNEFLTSPFMKIVDVNIKDWTFDSFAEQLDNLGPFYISTGSPIHNGCQESRALPNRRINVEIDDCHRPLPIRRNAGRIKSFKDIDENGNHAMVLIGYEKDNKYLNRKYMRGGIETSDKRSEIMYLYDPNKPFEFYYAYFADIAFNSMGGSSYTVGMTCECFGTKGCDHIEKMGYYIE